LFCTVFTPRTFIAMLSTVFFSSALRATPDSTTLPCAVSTWIASASTVLSSTSRALTVVVIAFGRRWRHRQMRKRRQAN